MKNFKRFAAVLSAICLAATLCACSKDGDTGENKDGVVQQQGGTLAGEQQDKEQEEQRVIENPTAPAYTISQKNISSSIKDAAGEMVLFSSEVGKLQVSPAENGNLEAARSIAKAMDNAMERNKAVSDSMMESYSPVDGVLQPWAFESAYEVVRNDAYALSVTEQIYMNAGGAYPTVEYFAYNFDAYTGKAINVEGLLGVMSTDNFEVFAAFDDVIYNKISENYGAEKASLAQENLGIKEGEQSIALANKAADCWYFNENGITIHYSSGKILPNAEGDIVIEIGADELKQISDKTAVYFA